MAPVKRASSAAASAAKRSRQNALEKTILGALADAEAVPANLRTLLKEALPVVLKANKVDRHAFEAEVVVQAQEALAAVQVALEQEQAAALAKQNAVIGNAEHASRAGAKTTAEAHLEAVKGQQAGHKATVKAAELTVQETDATWKAAQKEEKAAEKELQKYTDKKANLSDALANEFVLLSQNTSASAAGKMALKKLLAVGKEFALGSTLLATLPISCQKAPAGRSEFEKGVFSSVQALIEGQIQLHSQWVGEAEAVKAAKAAATASAREAFDHAKEALAAAEKVVEDTQVLIKEASKEVSKADHSLRHIWVDMEQACNAQDEITGDVKNFKENVMGAFNELKEKEPEPEPVEEPEPVAEVPAQDGSDLVPAAEAAVLPVAAP